MKNGPEGPCMPHHATRDGHANPQGWLRLRATQAEAASATDSAASGHMAPVQAFNLVMAFPEIVVIKIKNC